MSAREDLQKQALELEECLNDQLWVLAGYTDKDERVEDALTTIEKQIKNINKQLQLERAK